MKREKEYKQKALRLYDDLRDTVAVIEAMNAQGSKPGMPWQAFKKKLHAKKN